MFVCLFVCLCDFGVVKGYFRFSSHDEDYESINAGLLYFSMLEKLNYYIISLEGGVGWGFFFLWLFHVARLPGSYVLCTFTCSSKEHQTLSSWPSEQCIAFYLHS